MARHDPANSRDPYASVRPILEATDYPGTGDIQLHEAYLGELARLLIARFSPSNVLDCGCGRAELTQKFGQSGVSAFGIDLARRAIVQSDDEVRDYLVQGAVDHPVGMPFRGSVFDLVIAHHVVEHLIYPMNLVRELGRVLRPGGIVCVVTTVLPFGIGTRGAWRFLGLQRKPDHVCLHGKRFWIKMFKDQGFDFVGNINSVLLKDPPGYFLARHSGRLGPPGKWLSRKLLSLTRVSFLFSRT